MKLNPYIFYNGTCKEAFQLYERVLGGKIVMMLTHGETPAAGHVAPEWKDKIIHARMMLGEQALMASDAPPGRFHQPQGFSVNIGVTDPAEAERIFHALAENGKVTMPIGETFWALRFGMLVDRFGIPWMINCEATQKAAAADGKSQAQPGPSNEFVISRTFKAPRDLVFKAFTEPARMKQWWGPKGVTIGASKMDLRPGGTYHYSMRGSDGKETWGKQVYREIVAPERIVLVNSFSDAQGRVTRHPMAPSWPLEMLSTFLFTEKDGRTTFTVQWSPLNPTAEERATFDGGHDSMKQGWTGTLDQLEAYLAKAA
jgi:uncharacterized glyoxalase superfamily protein PhnB/uncharacterized protein YndB with AHSA1/START domain